MLRPVLVTPPTVYPVSLAELRAHAVFDDFDHDAELAAYIAAATAYLDGIDGILGRCLCAQTWKVETSSIGSDMLRLPLAPVASIVSVDYFDAEGVGQVLAASNYRLHADARGPYLRLTSAGSWPATEARDDALAVTFVAGYGAPQAVPEPIRHAIKLLATHWAENREPVVIGQAPAKLAFTVDSLLAPYKRRRLGNGATG